MDRYKREEVTVFGMVWWEPSVRSSCGIFNPYVVNKAGPDWMWGGGRDDVMRNLYFRPQRQLPPLRPHRAGRYPGAGSAALYWML